jgi:GAF domain-containing protein
MADYYTDAEAHSLNKVERPKALAQIIIGIRESLDLQTIFQTTVGNLRELLLVDQVGILHFEREKDWQGQFICEDVVQECKSVVGTQINGDCFSKQFAVPQASISAISYPEQEGTSDDYIQMLQRFNIRAYVIAPLYTEKNLWGLLCIHQCQNERHWESDEIKFVSQIAEYLGVVLQHHNLLLQVKYQAQQQAEYLQQVQEQAAQLARVSERDLAAQRQQTLVKMIDKIRQSLDIDTIFTYCTKELRLLLEAERVAIYRFRPDWSGEFLYEAQSGGWTPLIQHQFQHPELCDNISECTFKELCELNVTDTYLQQTEGGEFRPGEPFRICSDIYNANFSECYIQALERYQARAYAIIAVYQGQRVWGLLAVYQNSQPRFWQDSEIDLLVQISKHLGIALQQADYLQKLQTQANQLIKASERQRALITTVDKIRQSLDIDTIFKATTQEVRQLLEVERVAIYRFYGDWSGEFVADSIIDGFTPIVRSWGITENKLLQATKPAQYPRNETFVPILQGEKLWGLLVAYQNSAPRYWQEEEINLLAQVGVQLGVALQQAELLQQTQKQALELTQTLEDLQRTQAQLIQG